MIAKNKNWMLISIGALLLSVASLFLPVINYVANRGDDMGIRYSFNIINLLDGESFIEHVLSEYTGSFLFGISAGLSNLIIGLLCLIGLAAIVCSFIGLKSMSKQYESSWPFRLTLAGILFTAIPAIALLAVVLMSGNQFRGNISAGAYAYVTPIAMVVSYITVTKRHKLTQEERRIQQAASQYIKPAGDLPIKL